MSDLLFVQYASLPGRRDERCSRRFNVSRVFHSGETGDTCPQVQPATFAWPFEEKQVFSFPDGQDADPDPAVRTKFDQYRFAERCIDHPPQCATELAVPREAIADGAGKRLAEIRVENIETKGQA